MARFFDPKGNDSWEGQAASPIKDALTSQLTSGVTASLDIGDTTDFATSGEIVIFGDVGTEFIAYTGKTATTLTGLTRAQNSSSDVTHAIGSEVFQTTVGWVVIGPFRSLAKIVVSQDHFFAPGRYPGGTPVGTINANAIVGTGSGVIFDGEFSTATALKTNTGTRTEGIELRNYTGVALDYVNTLSFSVKNCKFRNNGVGLSRGSSSIGAVVASCVFADNAIGIDLLASTSLVSIIGCTFYRNGVAIEISNAIGSLTRQQNNAFIENTVCWTAGLLTDLSSSAIDNNGYFGNTNIATVNSITYADLTAWKAFLGQEANSREDDPLMNAPAKQMFGLRLTSPWRAAGKGDLPIGAFGVAVGITAGHPDYAAAWTSGELSGTQYEGDDVSLTAIAEGTFATDVVDLGKPRGIRAIRLFGVEDRPEAVFDKEKSDEFPNQQTCEVRADDASFLKGAAEAGDLIYTEVERERIPVLPNAEGNAQQFVQVRATIRSDGS